MVIDYSKFDHIGDSDSDEDEHVPELSEDDDDDQPDPSFLQEAERRRQEDEDYEEWFSRRAHLLLPPEARDGNESTRASTGPVEGHFPECNPPGTGQESTTSDFANDNGETALAAAAAQGKLDVVQFLVEEEAHLLNTKDINGDTPLLLACSAGHELVVACLTEQAECDLLARNEERRTALYQAAMHGHLAVVEILTQATSTSRSQPTEKQRSLGLSLVEEDLFRALRHVEQVKATDSGDRVPDPLFPFHEVTSEQIQEYMKILAAKRPNRKTIDFLLERVMGLNAPDLHSVTPMMKAAQAGHLEIVQHLFAQIPEPPAEPGQTEDARKKALKAKQEAMLECFDTGENTALMLAATNGHEEVVQFLISQGADRNAVDKKRRSAATLAAAAGHARVVQLLTDQEAEATASSAAATQEATQQHPPSAETKPRAKQDPAADAAAATTKASQFAAATEANQAKAERNSTAPAKANQPSAAAAATAPAATARTAGTAGTAATTTTTAPARTATAAAAAAAAAPSNRAAEEALLRAAEKGQLDVVIMLANQGTNLDVTNRLKMTPLLLASCYGHLPVVQFLAARGDCDISARDRNGWTALHQAVLGGHVKIAETLLAQGADLNAEGFKKMTPLITAALEGHLGVVKYLIKKGADMARKDAEGETALDVAQGEGHRDVMEYLTSQAV